MTKNISKITVNEIESEQNKRFKKLIESIMDDKHLEYQFTQWYETGVLLYIKKPPVIENIKITCELKLMED